MGQKEQTIDFLLELNGKQYKCSRVVTGTSSFTQTVYAVMDQEPDGMTYDHSNKVAMESGARIIARKLIERQA